MIRITILLFSCLFLSSQLCIPVLSGQVKRKKVKYKKIFKDKKFQYRNVKNKKIALGSKQKTSCKNFIKLPRLKQNLADATVDYSINFMWIYKDKKLGQSEGTLVPDSIGNLKPLSQVLFKWALLHPNAVINIWFDSKLTTKEAVFKTYLACLRYSKFYLASAPIRFRDVQSLDIVKKNKFICSDRLPVYYRADLLRIIATYEDLINNRTRYFVYVDLDMAPTIYLQLKRESESSIPYDFLNDFDAHASSYTIITQDESYDARRLYTIPFGYHAIFTPTVLKQLQSVGFCVRRGGALGFENSFHIVDGTDSTMLFALKNVLIDLNIERAKKYLNGTYWDVSLNPETVFVLYTLMYMYYWHLKGYIVLFAEIIDKGKAKVAPIATVDDEDASFVNPIDKDEQLFIAFKDPYEAGCFPSSFLKVAEAYPFKLTKQGYAYFGIKPDQEIDYQDLYSKIPVKTTPYHPVLCNYNE